MNGNCTLEAKGGCQSDTEIFESQNSISKVRLFLEDEQAFQTSIKQTKAKLTITTKIRKDIYNDLEQIINDNQVKKKKKRRTKLMKKSRAILQQKFNFTKNYAKLFGDKFSDYFLEQTKINLNKAFKDKASWKRVNSFSKIGLNNGQVSAATFNRYLIDFIKSFGAQPIKHSKIKSEISVLCYNTISRMFKRSIEEIEKEEQIAVVNSYLSIDKSWPEVIVTIYRELA